MGSVIPCTAVSIGVTDFSIGQICKCGVEIIACVYFAIVFEVILVISMLCGPACWYFAKVRRVVDTAAVDICRIAIASTTACTAVLCCVKVIICIDSICLVITSDWSFSEPPAPNCFAISVLCEGVVVIIPARRVGVVNILCVVQRNV